MAASRSSSAKVRMFDIVMLHKAGYLLSTNVERIGFTQVLFTGFVHVFFTRNVSVICVLSVLLGCL